MNQQKLSVANRTLIAHHNRRTLGRMRHTLLDTPCSVLRCKPAEHKALHDIYYLELKSRATPPRTKIDYAVSLIIPSGLTHRMPTHLLSKLMRHDTLQQFVPPSIHFTPVLRFGTGQQLGRSWISYKHIATKYSMAALNAIANGPCTCPSQPADIHPVLGHVCTTKPTFLPNNIQRWWAHGSRFQVRTGESLQDILAQLQNNIQEYCSKVELSNQLPAGSMFMWGHELYNLWHAAIMYQADTWQFPDDITMTKQTVQE